MLVLHSEYKLFVPTSVDLSGWLRIDAIFIAGGFYAAGPANDLDWQNLTEVSNASPS